MLKLSPRLQMAADMVRPGSAVADIGADHAFLPSFLVLSGVSPRALACDLRRGPLLNAAETVEEYGLQGKVTLRLSDGFDNVSPDEADDFIVCGMGGSLIAELLERAPWLKDSSKRLILQPQSHHEDVRRFLAANGYKIIAESACSDAGRLYSAMCAQYTGVVWEPAQSWYYVGELMRCNSPEADTIIRKTYKHLTVKLNALAVAGDEDITLLRQAVEELKEIIGEAQ